MHLLSGKTLEARRAQRPQTIIQNGSGGFAMEFNGTDEYLQIALPSDLAVFDLSALAHGYVGAPTGWTASGTTATVKTDVVGSSKCLEMNGLGGLTKSLLTSGKKYKIKIRYKANVPLNIGRTDDSSIFASLPATSEWNTISKVITADVTGIILFFTSTTSGLSWIESITFVEDQGFDLNKDQEQILHSKNWDFERTLGTELASGTVTIGSKYIVTAGTVEGNAIGTEFLAVTNATTLDANNKVKPIPNLATATFLNKSGAAYDTFTGASATGFTAVETDSSRGVAYQTFGFQSGKRYRFSYTITVNAFSFGVGLFIGDANVGTQQIVNHAATGTSTVTYDVIANAAHGYYGFRVEAGQTADFVVSGFHFYEIPEWTASGNHTQNLSILDKSGTGTHSMLVTASGAGISATECVTNGNCATYSGASPSQLATGWLIYSNDPADTATIVTGNGFSGNAQRIEDTSGNGRLGISFPIASTSGLKYKATITYRASHSFYFYASGIGTSISTANIPANTGNAITITIDVTPDYTNLMGIGFNADANKIGSWIEVSNVSVKQILGEVTLPSANIESVVSGKKYTLEGFARLDASSLGYDANLLTPDGTSGWTAGHGTGSVVAGEYVLASTGTGYIYRTLTSANKVLKVTFKAKADTYTGSIRVYHNSTVGAVSTGNLTGIYQTFTLYLDSHTAAATFYVQLNSSHTGNIYFDDITIQDATPITLTAQLGSKSVTSSALSIVAGTFTKFVLNFEATASEQSQDLKLYLSGAGSVFVDKLSLTQRYDWLKITKFKETTAREQWLFAINSGGVTGVVDDYINGSNALASRFMDGVNIDNPNTKTLTANVWYNYIALFDNTTIKTYFDGALYATDSTITIGKSIVASPLVIGAYGTGLSKFDGQISHLQIIRFENISQSTFNSALTGLQYPIGGGAEEVLRLTFSDGTTINNTLKDYSPMNHTITGVNIDSTNRRRLN